MFYILTLALVLRLIFFNQSLWLDESIQALALMGRMGNLMTYALADFQPPLYHGILWAWTSLFGFSEIALRTPALFAGLGTVYISSKIGQFLANKKGMILAGLLTATNPLLIYYSQEGRTYGITTLFVTVAIYYFVKAISNPVKKNLIPYLIFSALFLWTSYLSWFLHLSLLIYSILKKRRDLMFIQLASALTLVFWIPSLLASLNIGLSTVNSSPEWGQVVGGISFKALVLTWVKIIVGRVSFANKIFYGVLVSVIGAIHLYILSKAQKPKILLLWLTSFILPAIFSLFLPVYSYTRVMFVAPAYMILLALGLSRLKPIWTYLIVSSQILLLITFWLTPSSHREGWREVVADYGVESTYALPSLAQSAPLVYYGLSDSNLIEPKITNSFPASKIIYLKYVEDVFDIQKLGVSNLIKNGFTLKDQKVYPGIQLEVYENIN